MGKERRDAKKACVEMQCWFGDERLADGKLGCTIRTGLTIVVVWLGLDS